MFTQKRYVAHTYMSTKVDVSAIQKQTKSFGISFEAYVVKAASKAFKRIFPDHPGSVSHFASGLRFHPEASQSSLTAIQNSEIQQTSNFTDSTPSSAVTVTQVSSALECLPVSSPQTLISLHFSQPTVEVVPKGARVLDVESMDDSDISYDITLRQQQTSRISISFDI